jgi:hypothetical protein
MNKVADGFLRQFFINIIDREMERLPCQWGSLKLAKWTGPSTIFFKYMK